MTEAPTTVREMYGHYEILAVLGRGSMGVVYLARDQRIGRRVALKTVTRKPSDFDEPDAAQEYYSRIQREAEISGALNHPNIVTLYEVGYEEDRIAYLAMEFVEGKSLAFVLSDNVPMPVADALSIAEDVLSGLLAAHGAGVVHRDIKPANILLTADGRAKIADFGIARGVDSTLTIHGQLMGTPNYMSPEQVAGKPVSPASDLFSTGVVLYQMLTGTKPFVGNDVVTVLYNVVHEPERPLSTLNPDVPAWFAAFVHRMMSKDPAERFASAAEALAEIRKHSPTVRTLTDSSPAFVVSSRLDTPLPEDTPTTPLSLDQTEPITLWKRPVTTPAALVASILAVAALAATLSLGWAVSRQPSPLEIPPQTIAEWQMKKQQMTEARRLLESGQFQESRQAYERYLARYPWSAAAREGRDESIDRFQKSVAPEPARPSRVTRRAVAGEGEEETIAPEATTRPSLWQRVRRIFHRD